MIKDTSKLLPLASLQTCYPIGCLHLPTSPQVRTLVPSQQMNLVLVLLFFMNFNDDGSIRFDGGGI
jgi:hypothetical protein